VSINLPGVSAPVDIQLQPNTHVSLEPKMTSELTSEDSSGCLDLPPRGSPGGHDSNSADNSGIRTSTGGGAATVTYRVRLLPTVPTINTPTG